MAKISALSVAADLAGDELLPVVQAGITKRLTLAAFRASIVPYLQAWYKGDRGATGTSNNTRLTLADLKAAATSDGTSLYDGSVWTWSSGNYTGRADDVMIVAANGVPLTTGAWLRQVARQIGYANGRTLADKVGESVSPMDGFGAVGDGVADDTAALQAAINFAAARGRSLVIPAGYVFGIKGQVIIRGGLKTLLGQGGIIRELPDAPTFGLASDTGHTDLRIEGLIIQALGKNEAYGLLMRNASRCIVRNNVLTGFSSNNAAGILFRAYVNGPSCDDNIIEGNIVEGVGFDLIAAGSAGIQIDTGSQSTAFPDSNIIRGNRILGFQYGISLSNARNTLVTTNRISDSLRGVSMQNPDTVRNAILSNQITGSHSTAIHMNAGASDNLIDGNHITQNSLSSEGVIQAYNGSKRNRVTNNFIIANGTPEYHIYFACNASGNEASGNKCYGRALLAYIAVESAWEFGRAAGTASIVNRGYKTGVVNAATEATNDVVIRNNRIEGESEVPAIAATQYRVGGVDYALNRLQVHGNTVIGPAKHQLYLWEDTPGQLAGISAIGNNFDPAAGLNRYVLPRRGAHFTALESNSGTAFKTRLLGAFTPGGGSVPAGSVTVNGFGVAGAALGDRVECSVAGLPDGLGVHAFIANTGIGNIRWSNPTSAAIATTAMTVNIEISMRATG